MSIFLSQHLMHRENDFIIIDKPAGLLSVPGKGENLHDSVLTRLIAEEPKALLIHRLDRDTSGLLVFALSKFAQSVISKQFQERQTYKQYQAIVSGTLVGSGTIDIPVVYDPMKPPLHKVDESCNKPALTDWEVIENLDISGHAVTRVRLIPITGRSHQLRVHMQYLGHPIVGDTLYADSTLQNLTSRLCLHAERLGFKDPDTQEPLSFYCPAPF